MEFRKEVAEKGMDDEPELVTAASLQRSIRGVEYPADRRDLLEMAEKNAAPDSVKEIIQRMPDKEYSDAADVSRTAGAVK